MIDFKHNEMLKDMKAIIFDMDGTLIDSMWVWENIDIDFLKEFELTPPDTFHTEMEGMSYTEVAEYFLRIFPSLTMNVEELKAYWTQMAFDRYTQDVKVKEGIPELLAAAHENGILLGIATSNGDELVFPTLEALGLTGEFDSVHTACEVAEGKPAPDIYLLVAKELGVDPSECLVFEDVPKGVMAGKNAGMKTCAIYDEYSHGQEELKKELADYYINSFCDLESR